MRPKIDPKRELVELERWNGEEWIEDDGLPGIAFSGAEVLAYDRKRIKIGFHAYASDDQLRLAAERSLTKYKKSYGKRMK